jgi:hypothetical protein
MLGLLVLLAGPPPVINEVCYDPPGADAGAEFVEIFNPDTLAVALDGCRVEFGNGAGDPAWQLRWTAPAGTLIPPRACFLLADEGWQGPPAHATAALGLQNGPDALRLVRADGSTDTVGWGELAAPELHEGAPAPDVAGVSLARRPDGRDTQDNAADFAAAEPTPGALNWPDFAPRLVAWRWWPPAVAAVGDELTGIVELGNAGREDLAGARVRLRVGTATAWSSLGATPPDSTAVVSLVVRTAAAGPQPARLETWREAAAETLRWPLGEVQVGPAGLRLAEVMAAPTTGGEWCEIENVDGVPRNLAELGLRDEDGAWRALPEQVLAPGDCRLLVQDAAAASAWLAELTAAGVALPCDPPPPVEVPGWPALNNSAPASRDFADRLYLAEADGMVIDFVTLGLGTGRAPVGRSLERTAAGQWRPSTAPAGGTPGCLPPAPIAVTGGEVRLAPNPFSPAEGDGAVHVHLVVPDAAVGYELRIFDLWGRAVRDLGGDDLGPGVRELLWDGRDEAEQRLPAGGYVVLVRWRLPGGSVSTGARRLVVIREAGP